MVQLLIDNIFIENEYSDPCKLGLLIKDNFKTSSPVSLPAQSVGWCISLPAQSVGLCILSQKTEFDIFCEEKFKAEQEYLKKKVEIASKMLSLDKQKKKNNKHFK